MADAVEKQIRLRLDFACGNKARTAKKAKPAQREQPKIHSINST